MTDHILTTDNLHMVYPNGNGGLAALENVTLSVRRNEFLCIVGPSGCGKTTLLRILAGLLQPSSGSVTFEGEPIVHPRRRIGFVFQESNLMPWRTVLSNVVLPLELQNQARGLRESRAQDLIDLVGLSGFEQAYPRDLSGGMAQRVAIARALIHEPDILLLDEPFGSLDALTRERMETELIRIWGARTVTVIMVTHSITEAVLLADRLIVLSPRPASVVSDLVVPLPRPRNLDMTHTRPFGKVVTKVRSAIGDGA